MRTLLLLLSIVHAWLGLRALLNVLHVLRTSKYSKATTAVAAVVFLAMAAVGGYAALASDDLRLGFTAAIGPWLAGIVVMFLVLVTGRQQ